MLEGLSRLGAKIDFSDKVSGYALVTLARGKLLEALDVPGIAYAYTRDDDRLYYQEPDAKIPQAERRPEAVPSIEIPYPKVAKTLLPDGPFFDSSVIGLDTLWKEHPEADGRGVRVAVPDEGFDLLHPALLQAKDAAGNVVPKVSDLGTLTSPGEDSGWVQFGAPVQSKGGVFEAAGRTLTVPQDGVYRFGIFKRDLVLCPEGNSHVKKLAISVGVLWEQSTGRVWVDTDGDCSFKNQRALRDYALAQDVDWFGRASDGEDNRIPFGVKIDSVKDAVYIRIGGDHGALVAGPLAANKWTGGLFDGAAPSAQLIDSSSYRSTYLASLVQMFARGDVDVINRSGGLGRAGYTGSREGIEDFAQRVVERLIAVYDKPIATYSAAVGTIHVNDYAGPEMLRRNRQLGPPYRDTINSFVWDLANGLVNVVLAPSANLETESRYKPFDIGWPDGKRRSFSDDRFNPPAPDGYMIGSNNSPTIPVVSGVLADLIAEAKREHLRYNAVRLNDAIFTGARPLSGFPVSQQGYGLINAAQSWHQLVAMAKADDPANPTLTSFTISRMQAGHSVDIQGFHQDLPAAGHPVVGEISITRHGGFAGVRRYQLSLRGDAASFTLIDHSVMLVRDEPATVRFRATGAPGWNIAFLELRDAKADVVMQDVPLSVHAPAVPETIAPGVEQYAATIPPLHTDIKYVEVGKDVQAARYVMRIPYTGPENISSRDFPGGRYGDTQAPTGTPVDEEHHVGPLETMESLVANKEPGMQEIFWENRGRPEYATQYDGPAPTVPIHAELTVTKYAVSFAKATGSTLAVTNRLAAIEGKVELYDAKLASSMLKGEGPHGSTELETTLPAGLAEWRLNVTSDYPANKADIFLMDCTGKYGCYVAAQQEITANSEALVVDMPHPGKWRVVIRGRDQTTVLPSYQLREAMLTPTETPVESANGLHASGASWRVTLPTKKSDAQYAAFRIAGTPGEKREEKGLLIAVTPLSKNSF